MGRVVIVAYKPKPGKAEQLDEVVAKHLRVLAAERLVTDRGAYVMRGKDATVVEVFEWLSAEAIEQAHDNPAVLSLWKEFAGVCEFVPLATLPESGDMFAEFESMMPQARDAR